MMMVVVIFVPVFFAVFFVVVMFAIPVAIAFVVMVMMMVLFGWGGDDFQRGIEREAADLEDGFDGDGGAESRDDAGLRVGLPDFGFKGAEGGFVHKIGFIEKNQIGEGDLLDGFAFPVVRNVERVHHGDNAIEGEGVLHFIIHKEGLNDRSGIGQSSSFDEDVIEAVPAAGKASEDADEITADGAAEAAVVHREDFLIRLNHQFVVDGDFAEFILHDGNPKTMRGGKDAVEQGGLARAEVAGENGHGDFFRRIHTRVLAGGKPGGNPVNNQQPRNPRMSVKKRRGGIASYSRRHVVRLLLTYCEPMMDSSGSQELPSQQLRSYSLAS